MPCAADRQTQRASAHAAAQQAKAVVEVGRVSISDRFLQAMAHAGNPGISVFRTTADAAYQRAEGWMFVDPIHRPALTDARGDNGSYVRCAILTSRQFGLAYDWTENLRSQQRLTLMFTDYSDRQLERRINRRLSNPLTSEFWHARRPLKISELVTFEAVAKVTRGIPGDLTIALTRLAADHGVHLSP